MDRRSALAIVTLTQLSLLFCHIIVLGRISISAHKLDMFNICGDKKVLHECLAAAALSVLMHETVLMHKFIDACPLGMLIP